jgi:hypothetical protein
MSTVYVLIRNEYEPYDYDIDTIVGVFSTRSAAELRIPKDQPENTSYTIKEFQVKLD